MTPARRNNRVQSTATQHLRDHGQVSDWLVCPTCAVSVEHADSYVECPACRSRWPVVDDVPHFITDFPYWGEISIDQMREINRAAVGGSWKSALLQASGPRAEHAAEMILNLERANWHCLLDLGPDTTVLDLGAGMGTNSHALAMRFRHVVALEPVEERVRFMRQRFKQENLPNVRVVRSSVWDLPFPPGSFDLIAMNGVLEWVASGQKGDPRELQERALRNALRLLRPGGYLYVGIENRLAAGYFLGYGDPHCGLPLVTILPRALAHAFARAKGHNGYRNYLYSAAGYRKLVRKAGFDSADIYLALPTYNHPRFFMPLDRKIFSYYSRSFTAVHRNPLRAALQEILLKTGLLQYCEYSFAIMARKKPAG